MLKKTIIFTLCLLLVFSVVGCSNNDKPVETLPTTEPTTIPTENVPLEEPPINSEVPNETQHIHNYQEETVPATCLKIGYTVFTCDCGDKFISNEKEKTGHDYEESRVNASCTEKGYTLHKCKNCDDSYVDSYVEKISHDYQEEYIKPTCTKKGYTLYTCKNCKTSYKDNYLDRLEHVYNAKIIEPTCSKEGYTVHTCDCGDTYTDSKTEKLPHNYKFVVTQPTCNKKGYTTFTCSVCKDTYIDDYVDTIPHSYKSVVTEPTCTSKGFTTYTCKCGDSYTSDETEVTPHSYKETITAPTCSQAGYSTFVCNCGDSYTDNETPMLNHDWSDWEIIVKATCSEMGVMDRKCKLCDLGEGQTIPKLPHTYTDSVVKPTCTTQGYTLHKCECGHSYKDNVTEITPHIFSEWEITKEVTCTTDGVNTRVCSCGEKEVEAVSKLGHDIIHHDGKPSTCKDVGWEAYDTCSRCEYTNYKEIALIGHAFADWYIAKEATCTEKGTKARMCLNCHKIEEKDVLMLEHTFINYVSDNNATCTEDGTKTAVCVCGKTDTVIDEGSQLGHSYKDSKTAPTCTERGYTTYTCERCEDAYIDDYVETIDHACYAEVTEPTCTKEGYTTIICNMCGAMSIDGTTPALGHSYTNYISDNNATCTENGTKTATCDRNCGEKDTVIEENSVLGHNYKDTVVAPTCKEQGYTLHECILCGHNYKDNTTNIIDHVWGDWIVVKPSSVKEEGQEERTCENCGETETQTIPVIKLDEAIVAYYVVSDGKVVDLVSGVELTGAVVSGNYFHSGTVKLPQSYSNWTYQMIVDYNESSTAGIVKLMKFNSNSGKYEECDNVFKLNELNAIYNRGSVRIPWVKDSWNSGYTVTIPVQLYAHMSTNYEFLPIGDTFWSFSMDSDNGILNSRINGATASTTMSTYTTTEGETKYVSKILPASFTFTNAHLIKELIIYNQAQTIEEQENAYKQTGIVAPQSGINEVVDGLTDMGSSFYVIKYLDGSVKSLASETLAGTYTVTGESGISTSYTISDYVHPDLGIDNSKYESVHITNEPKTLDLGKQYPLVAYPYPFNIIGADGKSDKFDVVWSSSNNDIISVIDGLLITKKTGTVTITATLTGTDISDSVTIKVVKPQATVDKSWNVPNDYTSANGDSFSETDYAMTTRAIYAAIDEAHANGYNHIIFPKIKFYAQPITNADGTAKWYYVPSNMTIEFPEGSVFYMMDNEVSRGPGNLIEIHYFHFGVPNNDHQNVCENSHLIMDTFYGERYNTTHKETEYLEENRFVNFGRKSINCSVEVRNAYSPAGYFIVADGTSNTNKKTGVMNRNDFVAGWLNDNGEIEENANWISTSNFIVVPDYGTDGYFISAHGQDSYAGKYWNGCSARTYDILWYDENQELILTERFLGRGDYYDIPANAVYFKVSLQQSALPTEDMNDASPYIAMHSDGASKFCEIKNTNVWNSACGVFSVVGQTDGFWVHHSFTNRDGMKPYNERTGDFENGWTQMRHSIVSNNSFKGYFANHGYNTFIHTNYMPNYSGFSGEAELLRYINNTTDYVELSEKCQAHIFYNTLYTARVDYLGTSIGHVHTANNKTGQWVRSY